MAVFAATDYYITVGGTDLSDRLSSVELPITVAELDTTNFDSGGWNERIGGLKDSSVSLNFHQDFATSEVEATVYPLIGTKTEVVVKPTSSTTSGDNPQYAVSCIVTDWKPIAAKVGDLAVSQVSWPGSGAVVKTTS